MNFVVINKEFALMPKILFFENQKKSICLSFSSQTKISLDLRCSDFSSLVLFIYCGFLTMRYYCSFVSLLSSILLIHFSLTVLHLHFNYLTKIHDLILILIYSLLMLYFIYLLILFLLTLSDETINPSHN